jgi:uncharacterized protein (UPF0332 family)
LTLHHDLLEQAQYLAYRESGKPRQASLRRAVSAAYYSLFHLLLHEATHLLFPAKPTTLRDRARRAFTHSEAKNVCETFARKEGGIKDLTTQPLEQQLSEIAATFVELQEARQRADYDLTQTFERVQVVGYVDDTRFAMAKWETIKNKPNANVFLAALLVHNRWNKYNR